MWLPVTALLRRESMGRAGREAKTVAEHWQDIEEHATRTTTAIIVRTRRMVPSQPFSFERTRYPSSPARQFNESFAEPAGIKNRNQPSVSMDACQRDLRLMVRRQISRAVPVVVKEP